ncbi:alpha/beta hydrolase [Chryseolinea sp. H1M3-3]|uniref:alpha/beta hydrolase n=1 Tax=Chryseolinea sp. H1M3-3 TaxID=3034144 RepID=UPI0023EB8DF3|nr:alpha/beta hydrolase [Chryseolinea sp. H1M3-3]
MQKHLTFFHGGGSKEDYEADAKLVESLKVKLGSGYTVHYPLLDNDGTPDLGRRKQISEEISTSEDNIILLAHSLGASMLLACLSENKIRKKVAGIFLLATPFWNGKEDWVEAFKLRPNFAKQLDKKTPLFFYHCRDDEEVPFGHLTIYRHHLPWASFREISVGGHQFNNDLTIVANDIKSI